ncbi:UDP-3-O-[3-hydroxymyristoyl] glucosamine N-acyltransferase [Microbacterium resistens]|uniref:UDP-3-O-[3-hydroxymyristoyl] glucosamine N-acyltransferase n=1 Tax=Microbacterium resistens TaxID=156977 RepID=A0ABU1SBM5_9MICO|nr:LpxD N-terminal domain-containing protein [Microbacterium resistens]MDR6866318.1 UDP-3-O-[3-hydroxymyristoyl] glucosamine N-acyltransferase [Microbacterium resistens]
MSSSALEAATVAAGLDAELIGAGSAITAPAAIQSAGAGSLTFAVDVIRYAEALERALHAGAVVIAPAGTALPQGSRGALILTDNPRAAFALAIARHFTEAPEPGIADTARVHPSAIVHESATVGEFTVIRAGAVIGARSVIRDHVVVGTGVRIGEDVLVKSHAVIGEEGFGIEKDAAGDNFRIPHIGGVEVGDHVEIGCFTTVCAGTISPTTIGDHTKVDDHVHIAHNCLIGRNVIVTACAEISGSVIVEDEVWIGPNASVIDGIVVGRGALLGIGATAIRAIPEYDVRAGNPAKRIGTTKR